MYALGLLYPYKTRLIITDSIHFVCITYIYIAGIDVRRAVIIINSVQDNSGVIICYIHIYVHTVLGDSDAVKQFAN